MIFSGDRAFMLRVFHQVGTCTFNTTHLSCCFFYSSSHTEHSNAATSGAATSLFGSTHVFLCAGAFWSTRGMDKESKDFGSGDDTNECAKITVLDETRTVRCVLACCACGVAKFQGFLNAPWQTSTARIGPPHGDAKQKIKVAVYVDIFRLA